jgi:UDP-N-acetylmuramyl pentapeptide synthase
MRSTIVEGMLLRDRFFSDYEIICVLGEMREIGDSSIQEHKDL